LGATLHVAATALPVILPIRPYPALVRAAHFCSPYLNLLFLNHGYSFYAPEPGISQALNVQITRAGVKSEYWLQDPGRYATDLSFIRHQGLAKAFTGAPAVSMALAQSLSRYICRNEAADTVRLTWALHPELPRPLAGTDVNPNAARFFANPLTVADWTCKG
jgi:hypothetical protein